MIRNDGSQYWTLMENNIIMNSSGGITLKDGCVARNNYIIDITYPPDAPKHVNRVYTPFKCAIGDTLAPISLSRNLVCFQNTPIDNFYQAKDTDFDKVRGFIEIADDNLYWSFADPKGTDELLKASREWGLDMRSVVADPGFKDASAGDFSISGESPLDDLGIKRLDKGKMGLYD